MDRIKLKSLSFKAKHGYYDKERDQGNQFEVDLVAFGSFRAAATSDTNLKITFDYERAEKIVHEVMNGTPKKLIETLCSEIGSRVFNEFDIIKKLRVSVRKLHPPIQTEASYAEVRLEWKR